MFRLNSLNSTPLPNASYMHVFMIGLSVYDNLFKSNKNLAIAK